MRVTVLYVCISFLLHVTAKSQWQPQPASGTGPIYYAGGHVGIGTSSPAQPLEVIGRIRAREGIYTGELFGGSSGGLYAFHLGSISNMPLAFFTGSSAPQMVLMNSTGNVGIGTSAPSARLQGGTNSGDNLETVSLTGDVRLPAYQGSIAYLQARDSSGANSIALRLRTQNQGALTEVMHLSPDGYVGVGSTSPHARLSILGAGSRTGVGNGYSFLRIQDSSGGAGLNAWDVLTRVTEDGLSIANVGDNAIRLHIDGEGNVGIGTTTPARRLHVQGDIYVSGNINAKYQDLAEWVPATEELPAGTVVVLSPYHSNLVISSRRAYDTAVAGVISPTPGITLGDPRPGDALVATTGRVRVRVHAGEVRIRTGDLLVTSDTPGTAMASVPVDVGGLTMHRPGTILGKALEPLSEGLGEILVLLSLQ